ncbi:MAG: 50S ribosomal protein L19 [Candidatus Buchananbacteria bacterium RIFCSPHIGHO2_01_FULL_39_14]|uniref:50S ribosomal protein L19 n=2 Tax=Candidatus Buchananiibacteriota TaxID=1817903 RepID=A0A1G1YQG8_9BACT|nr:MAG: 50S ribosomal protein L19 [Candidatus Buchananbacteria bacterium RIFCSPHIGHO2_01_FULL_39_14]OGY48682.1 MAG: 50S ribosomal protein L19 [Candidatus Buchananbacteria bacterium RIFCSPHIGHO2_02_FULL_39_17]OGY54544.1 MAG: 50S ribosomal protein L19 [Candidatus Buchananbacteria bacterium RIFCSPLOWO2_01_FULL_40_23b]
MAKDKKAKASEHEDKLAKKKIEKEALPTLKPGMTVRVHQLISEQGPKGEKQRIQIYEGIIISHHRGLEPGATITVRKISDGVGVEKIFPLYSPNVIKIEPVKQAKVTKAKLYYLRDYSKRLKEEKIA